MKYIRGIYRNEFLLSFVLGLIATWILSSPAEAAKEKHVNVKTRAMIERIENEKRAERVERDIDRCSQDIIRNVDSETAPAAVEACYQPTVRKAVIACRGEYACIEEAAELGE